jgi:hypothetical protein
VIHHVQLACPPGSEPALREFYCHVLGLDEIPKPPGLAAGPPTMGQPIHPGPLRSGMGPGSVVAAGGPELERGRVWAWPRLFSGGSPMVSW